MSKYKPDAVQKSPKIGSTTVPCLTITRISFTKRTIGLLNRASARIQISLPWPALNPTRIRKILKRESNAKVKVWRRSQKFFLHWKGSPRISKGWCKALDHTVRLLLLPSHYRIPLRTKTILATWRLNSYRPILWETRFKNSSLRIIRIIFSLLKTKMRHRKDSSK